MFLLLTAHPCQPWPKEKRDYAASEAGSSRQWEAPVLIQAAPMGSSHPFCQLRSHSHAGKAKLFWDVCERSAELGKGTEKPQNKDVFQYPSDPRRSTRGAAAASDAGCRLGCVGHSLPAPARWLFPFGKSFSISKQRGWDGREQPLSLREANSNLDGSDSGQLGRLAGNAHPHEGVGVV